MVKYMSFIFNLLCGNIIATIRVVNVIKIVIGINFDVGILIGASMGVSGIY